MSEAVILNRARLNLITVLADRAPVYFSYLKQWFRMQSTKEQFDTKARRLLNYEQVHYHNQFLMALLNRVEGLAESSVSVAHQRALSYGKNRRKPGEASTSADPDDTPRFDAVDLIDYLPPSSPHGAGSDAVRYAAQEIFLPDHGLILGRFMLAAWDNDLESVEDEAANIMVVATQTFLKNVLTAVVAQCKTYKTKGRSMYDLGGDKPSMWLRNSAKVVGPSGEEAIPLFGTSGTEEPKQPQTSDEIEHAAAVEMACSSAPQDVLRVTLNDVYTTLLDNRNIIASQSVYSINMERILLMMDHPST